MWVKIITGGDGGYTRSPNVNSVTCASTCISPMVTNRIPFDISDTLISKRVILAPFQAQFVDNLDLNNSSHRLCDVCLKERLSENSEFMVAFSKWV